MNRGKHSKHSANRARVKKEEMLTKYTPGADPLLSKIAAICLFREMFEEADPQLL